MHPAPDRVLICPAPFGSPPVSNNQTLQKIESWTIALQAKQLRQFQIRKKSQDALPPTYEVGETGVDSLAAIPAARPPDGGWLAFDWAFRTGVALGQFEDAPVYLSLEPNPSTSVLSVVVASPASRPRECSEGAAGGGMYFVQFDAVRGSLEAVMASPERIALFAA